MAATERAASMREISALVGDIEAEKLEAIRASGASVAEIEQALAWAAGESDVLGDEDHRLAGPIGQVYAILLTEQPDGDRER